MGRIVEEKLSLIYAKIENAEYGVNDRDGIGLAFSLSYANGGGTSWELGSTEDIKQLLTRTKAMTVKRLNGKVICYATSDMSPPN